MSIWGGIFGGAADITASAISSAANYKSTIAANEAMLESSAANRDWMERMSNTAHQREVKDLRKAGLNPILASGNLSGASTPSVSTDYTQQAPKIDLGRPGTAFVQNMATAAQADKANAETEVAKEQEKNVASTTELNKLKVIQQGFDNIIQGARAAFASATTKAQKDKAEAEAQTALYNQGIKAMEHGFWTSPAGHSAYADYQKSKSLKYGKDAVGLYRVGNNVWNFIRNEVKEGSKIPLDAKQFYNSVVSHNNH